MPETKHPLKVFLCHASADKPKVREFYRNLRRRGIRPWFDEMDLVGGHDWQVEIPKALSTSDAIIICLTKNSVDKEGYIQKEIKFALDKALEMPEGRIFLIPVRFEECEVPFSLRRYQWVDLYEKGGFSQLTKALKERARQLERSTIELSQSDVAKPSQTLITEQSTVDNLAPEMIQDDDLARIFFYVYKKIAEKYFAYLLISCLILSAVTGGLLWNVLNVLLDWTFQSGGSGNEPHNFQAFIWGVISFFPVLFFAGLAGYGHLASKRGSAGRQIIVGVLYTLFAGLGSLAFYDLGFRNFVEMLELGYGIQELIIVSIWSFVISLLISVPFLVFNRTFTSILNLRYILLQIPLSVFLAFFAIMASLFIPRPENEIAQLRGFIAAVALRVGLFIGMYLAISRPQGELREKLLSGMKINKGTEL